MHHQAPQKQELSTRVLRGLLLGAIVVFTLSTVASVYFSSLTAATTNNIPNFQGRLDFSGDVTIPNSSYGAKL